MRSAFLVSTLLSAAITLTAQSSITKPKVFLEGVPFRGGHTPKAGMLDIDRTEPYSKGASVGIPAQSPQDGSNLTPPMSFRIRSWIEGGSKIRVILYSVVNEFQPDENENQILTFLLSPGEKREVVRETEAFGAAHIVIRAE
jgi:hypothetical protein